MTEGKRTRRTRNEILQDKISKLEEQRKTLAGKISDIDKEVKKLEEELNNSRIDELAAKLQSTGLSVDEALAALDEAASAKKN